MLIVAAGVSYFYVTSPTIYNEIRYCGDYLCYQHQFHYALEMVKREFYKSGKIWSLTVYFTR